VVEERCSCGKLWLSFDKLKLSRDVCDVMFTWDGATATAAALRSRSGKSRRPHQSNDSELSKEEDMRMTHLFDGGTAQLSWTFLIRLFHPSSLPRELALLDVRYSTVQYCIVLHCIVLYCIVLYSQPTPPLAPSSIISLPALHAFMELRDFM
jgi:hypothetical protein